MQDQEYQAYREYFPLAKKVEGAPQIIVFFSFASRESYQLIHPFENELIGKLQHFGYDVKLVPVDFYSPYDNFLADAWCIADYLDDRLNRLRNVSREQYFDDVLFWMNEHQSSGSDDGKNGRIQFIVRWSGLSRGVEYSEYTGILEKCNNRRKELIKTFNVTSVPSVYVNGEYLINEGVMSTLENGGWDYIELINYLRYYEVE